MSDDIIPPEVERIAREMTDDPDVIEVRPRHGTMPQPGDPSGPRWTANVAAAWRALDQMRGIVCEIIEQERSTARRQPDSAWSAGWAAALDKIEERISELPPSPPPVD
jgi:hypothetical protein